MGCSGFYLEAISKKFLNPISMFKGHDITYMPIPELRGHGACVEMSHEATVGKIDQREIE